MLSLLRLSIVLGSLGLCGVFLVSTFGQDAKTKPFVGVFGDDFKRGDKAGFLVREVMPLGPAAKAGIKVGDLIVKAGDKAITSFREFGAVVNEKKPGDSLKISVSRDDKEEELTVTLGTAGPRGLPEIVRPARIPALGVLTRPLNEELKKQLDVTVDKGAVVMEVIANTAASKAGIKKDDVITQIGEQSVASPEEIREALQKVGIDKDVTITILRGKEKSELKAHLQAPPALIRPMVPELRDPNRELQQKVQDLEKRVRDLEQKLNELKKS